MKLYRYDIIFKERIVKILWVLLGLFLVDMKYSFELKIL